jgi:hypothetical protein
MMCARPRSTGSGKRGGTVSPPGRPKVKRTPSGGSAVHEVASVGAHVYSTFQSPLTTFNITPVSSV